jgi:integrase/recombinase XerD
MDAAEQARFERLYQQHLLALKTQGERPRTIDAYSRAVRRLRDHFDCCPDTLSPRQLRAHFAGTLDSNSWSTVKLDRCGLQFFCANLLYKLSLATFFRRFGLHSWTPNA